MEAKTKKNILAIIIIGFLIRLFAYLKYSSVWWDSAAYIGIGKFIFSLGNKGLFEPLRPPVWPVLIGALWKININPVFAARVLSILFSTASIYLVFLIAARVFDKRTAIISSFIFATSAVFVFYDHVMLSEIPSLFFALLSINLFLKKRRILAGFFAGISFLTRFPQGIIFASLILYVMLFENDKKNTKENAAKKTKNRKINIFVLNTKLFSQSLIKNRILETIKILVGFVIAAVPYLILNYLLYKNSLLPFIEGNYVIENTFPYSGISFYFINIIRENFMVIFSVPAVYIALKNYFSKKQKSNEEKGKENRKKIIKEERKEKLLFIIISILFLAYFSFLKYKEMRFAIVFLPYILILSAHGLKSLIRNKKILLFLLIIFLMQSSYAFVRYRTYWEAQVPDAKQEEFYKSIIGKYGNIWVSNPRFTLYTDAMLNLMYYPTFEDSSKSLKEKISKADFVFLNSCELVCRTEECLGRKKELLQYLKENFSEKFRAESMSANEKCEMIEFDKKKD